MYDIQRGQPVLKERFMRAQLEIDRICDIVTGELETDREKSNMSSTLREFINQATNNSECNRHNMCQQHLRNMLTVNQLREIERIVNHKKHKKQKSVNFKLKDKLQTKDKEELKGKSQKRAESIEPNIKDKSMIQPRQVTNPDEEDIVLNSGVRFSIDTSYQTRAETSTNIGTSSILPPSHRRRSPFA